MVFYNPSYRWRAVYETDRHTAYDIDGTEIDECPVSYVSPAMAELASTVEVIRQAREATGENPVPPVRLWPVRLLDAARLINYEKLTEHNTRIDAENHEREG